MKLITFDYTKKQGDTSERYLLVLKNPGQKYYAGIDLSQIEPENAAAFVKEYQKLHDEFQELVLDLQARYDLKHSYRQFIPEGMTNVIDVG